MNNIIPYGRQWIDEDDISAVCEVLRSPFITTGPMLDRFEKAVCEYTGARYGAAVSSGTAALHAAMAAVGIGPGDEVIVPPMTFAATANAVVYMGGRPVFADVLSENLLIDPDKIRECITDKTKAITVVDYAGHPCDYESLQAIAHEYGLKLIADSCHALGASYKDRKLGTWADITLFSFHPVKPITTGEGGMAVTNHAELAEKMKAFRNHGITVDYKQREQIGSWYYEIVDVGYNYRMTDFQCALGKSQMGKLDEWIARRNAVARMYDEAFDEINEVTSLSCAKDIVHGYHLYVIKTMGVDRTELFRRLWEDGIKVNVHYIPVHLHPFYLNHFGYGKGMCPVAENAYEQILSLPVFPRIEDAEVRTVIDSVIRHIKKVRG